MKKVSVISMTTDKYGTPKVSVLLRVYNAEQYLRAAVASVLNQTFVDFELLAFDDGSSDRSLSILREVESNDSRVRVLSSRERRGLVVPLNEMIAIARGTYLAIMDSDDICRPTRFEKQVAYLDTHPNFAVVGSRVLLIDPGAMPICEFNYESTHEEIDAAHLSGMCRVCHPSAMMRKEAVVQAGLYREEYQPAEDLDLFLRIAEGKGKLANLSEPLLEYRQHHGSMGHTRSSAQRNMARRAMREAWRRRGITDLPETAGLAGPEALTNQHRVWAWWALSAGNLATARKHAILALARDPVSFENLKLLACAIRGY